MIRRIWRTFVTLACLCAAALSVSAQDQSSRVRVEEINAATSEAVVRPRDNPAVVQISRTYSWRTSLPPYGVMLVEAERLE
jgi:hypothetical protein